METVWSRELDAHIDSLREQIRQYPIKEWAIIAYHSDIALPQVQGFVHKWKYYHNPTLKTLRAIAKGLATYEEERMSHAAV